MDIFILLTLQLIFQQNWILLLGVTLIFGVVSFLIYQINKLRSRNNILEARVKELSTSPAMPKTEGLPKENNNNAVDDEWLKKVEAHFRKHYSEPHFKMEWIAYEMNLSERQLTRRLEHSTGMTPNHYLRDMRLEAAKEMLTSGRYSTVKEVCFAVGFLDTRYFSRLFLERFGAHPSAYLK